MSSQGLERTEFVYSQIFIPGSASQFFGQEARKVQSILDGTNTLRFLLHNWLREPITVKQLLEAVKTPESRKKFISPDLDLLTKEPLDLASNLGLIRSLAHFIRALPKVEGPRLLNEPPETFLTEVVEVVKYQPKRTVKEIMKQAQVAADTHELRIPLRTRLGRRLLHSTDLLVDRVLGPDRQGLPGGTHTQERLVTSAEQLHSIKTGLYSTNHGFDNSLTALFGLAQLLSRNTMHLDRVYPELNQIHIPNLYRFVAANIDAIFDKPYPKEIMSDKDILAIPKDQLILILRMHHIEFLPPVSTAPEDLKFEGWSELLPIIFADVADNTIKAYQLIVRDQAENFFEPRTLTMTTRVSEDQAFYEVVFGNYGPAWDSNVISEGQEEGRFTKRYSGFRQSLGQGTGIGLWGDAKILEQAGGELVARRKRDRDGTEVGANTVIRLPIKRG